MPDIGARYAALVRRIARRRTVARSVSSQPAEDRHLIPAVGFDAWSAVSARSRTNGNSSSSRVNASDQNKAYPAGTANVAVTALVTANLLTSDPTATGGSLNGKTLTYDATQGSFSTTC